MKRSWHKWAAVAVFLIFVIGGWVAAELLHLKGTNFWILIGAFAALGIIGAGVLLWWGNARQASMSSQAGQGAVGTTDTVREIDLLVREAQARLKASRLGRKASIGNLPVILLLGETGAGKTSVMVGSGFDPELLAGHVSDDGKIAPTRSLNLWFTRDVVFSESAGKLLSDAASWTRLLRRISPRKFRSILRQKGPAPRAVVVCVSCETFMKAGAAKASSEASRLLATSLNDCARQFGINLPVYVLFTKADRIPFFNEYAQTFLDEEVGQVCGATLPAAVNVTAGVYAEQETRRLTAAFDELFCSLSDYRTELLPRQYDPGKVPGTYEYPREFRKLRSSIVHFLVDLCRPSQLTVSPFLRGFYFTGTRTVVVDEQMPATAETQGLAEQPTEETFGATRVFNIGSMDKGQAPRLSEQGSGATRIFDPRQMGSGYGAVAAPRTRTVQQPAFLSGLFNDILLKDRAGLAVSGSSTGVNFWRRALLAAAAMICMVFAVGFIVSYIGNKRLNSELTSEVQASQSVSAASPLSDSLHTLDKLRQTFLKIQNYNRNGAPWHLRWGLFTGRPLTPLACRAYSSKFREVLLNPVQRSLVASLSGLPSTPTGEYGPAYDKLRAYLITTTNPEKSDPSFLTPELFKTWSAGRTTTSEQAGLARTQFDFYGNELRYEAQAGNSSCFASTADKNAVAHARAYLNLFPPEERVYRAMLADASKTSPPIVFVKTFPNSSGIVLAPQEISGAYTKEGWAFMQKALDNPQPYMKGEPWVLGSQVKGAADAIALQQKLRQRYQNEFADTWRKFLSTARVAGYSNLRDASRKLEVLAGNTSPLLELFWLISHNVSADSGLSKEFQPVEKVVPPSDQSQYISSANQNYLVALLNLKSSIDQVVQQPQAMPAPSQTSPITNSAGQARNVAEQMALNFTPDPSGHVDTLVKKLLVDPIINVQSALPKPGEALNKRGRTFCSQFDSLLRLYPFSSNSRHGTATVSDFTAVFQPNDGALSKFYSQNLASLLTFTGSQYVPIPGSPIQLNPAFLRFFNHAMLFQRVLYPNGSTQPQLRFSIGPLPSEAVKQFTLTIDGQTLVYPGGPVQIVWSPLTAHEVRQTVGQGGVTYPGTWGVFSLFRDATWKASGSGYNLTWVQKNGEKILYLPNNQPMTVGVHLDMMGAPPIFEPGYFSNNFGCVSKVAK